MLKLLKNLLKKEDGMGTVEIVIIIAVLVGIALIFRGVIFEFVKNILKGIFGEQGSFSPNSNTDSIINEITSQR